MTGFWYAILQTKPDESFSPMIMKLVANTLKVFFSTMIPRLKNNILAYLHMYQEQNPPI